jgi:hypothetical protein
MSSGPALAPDAGRDSKAAAPPGSVEVGAAYVRGATASSGNVVKSARRRAFVFFLIVETV